MKVVKRYKVPFTRLLSTRDLMYNMINIINTALCYMKVVKRVYPKSYHIFFAISLIFYLYEMMNLH